MTTYTLVRLYCDGEDCQEEVVLSSHRGGLNITRAIYAAREQGWQRTYRKGEESLDYCPKHRTAALAFHAFDPDRPEGKPYRMCKAVIGRHTCWRAEDDFIHTGGKS